MIEKVKADKGAFGFNADKNDYEDLMQAGIIDPTKVARLALQNACFRRRPDADDRGHDRREA